MGKKKSIQGQGTQNVVLEQIKQIVQPVLGEDSKWGFQRVEDELAKLSNKIDFQAKKALALYHSLKTSENKEDLKQMIRRLDEAEEQRSMVEAKANAYRVAYNTLINIDFNQSPSEHRKEIMKYLKIIECYDVMVDFFQKYDLTFLKDREYIPELIDNPEHAEYFFSICSINSNNLKSSQSKECTPRMVWQNIIDCAEIHYCREVIFFVSILGMLRESPVNYQDPKSFSALVSEVTPHLKSSLPKKALVQMQDLIIPGTQAKSGALQDAQKYLHYILPEHLTKLRSFISTNLIKLYGNLRKMEGILDCIQTIDKILTAYAPDFVKKSYEELYSLYDAYKHVGKAEEAKEILQELTQEFDTCGRKKDPELIKVMSTIYAPKMYEARDRHDLKTLNDGLKYFPKQSKEYQIFKDTIESCKAHPQYNPDATAGVFNDTSSSNSDDDQVPKKEKVKTHGTAKAEEIDPVVAWHEECQKMKKEWVSNHSINDIPVSWVIDGKSYKEVEDVSSKTMPDTYAYIDPEVASCDKRFSPALEKGFVRAQRGKNGIKFIKKNNIEVYELKINDDARLIANVYINQFDLKLLVFNTITDHDNFDRDTDNIKGTLPVPCAQKEKLSFVEFFQFQGKANALLADYLSTGSATEEHAAWVCPEHGEHAACACAGDGAFPTAIHE